MRVGGWPVTLLAEDHLTFAVHAHLQALEQTAVLAAVALLARHLAVAVAAAAVDALVADAALEEALAALAGDDSVVQAGGAVSADEARALLCLVIWGHAQTGHQGMASEQ